MNACSIVNVLRDNVLKTRSNFPRPVRFPLPIFILTILFVIFPIGAVAQKAPEGQTENGDLQKILSYIHTSWDTLTRSTTSCDSVVDPKLKAEPVIYLPADFSAPQDMRRMQQECKVRVEHLPKVLHELGTIDPGTIQPPGLLYLEHSYVVPGGRFNEMYGWDSYFIIRGLLRDGRTDLARGMVENFFYEIEHYGAVLNANRTYYLTRSQPPFLSSMVMAVHEAQRASGKNDREWMERAYAYVKRDHALWTKQPHLAGDTGLSRYFDFGSGPAVEGLQDENDVYRQVAAYFVLHPDARKYISEVSPRSSEKPVGAKYSVRVCSEGSTDACEPAQSIALTPDYYKGDRSMRESGFDVSFRFGPFGAATHHYAPVCLNSLLYKTEADLESMARALGKTAEADEWKKQAEQRRAAMQKYLWDEQRGLFFDYNFDTHQRSTYEYATTFYPLWAGLATKAQAEAVIRNLKLFEKPGGIVMSLHESQGQWDFPFGWAPLQLLSVEGMRRYGYNSDADRVSVEFLSTVLGNFEREGTIREKYNVVTRSSETNVKAGYSANVTGFGWTNGTFAELLHALPKEKVPSITRSSGAALP